MNKALYYKFDTFQYEYYVDENFDDIFEYLFEQKYHTKYSRSWYLEEGAWDFYKDFEYKWWHNTFDTYGLYSDFDFTSWLNDKYENEAYAKYKIDYDIEDDEDEIY